NILKNNKINALIVGSGGCTLFSILNDNIERIDVIDNNIEQIFLIELKLEVICYLKEKDKILDFFAGLFDKNLFDEIFDNIKPKLSLKCCNYWEKNKDCIYKGINQNGTFELLFKELVET